MANPNYTWKGLPFDGEPVVLRNNDPKHLQPTFSVDGQCAIFDLWEPEHVARYSALLGEVGTGKKIIFTHHEQWVEEKKNWKVLITWLRPHYTNPSGVRTELSL